jgi:hypothetical protein
MSNNKFIIVTIDVECDKSPTWHTQHPLSYKGVLDGIPNRLQPVFERSRIRPTYLLSPEIITNDYCCDIFKNITDCELGSHLHGDYIVPKIKSWNFGNTITDDMQWEYSFELEKEKLAVLTQMFIQQFGFKPVSFRAGRFGIGHNTGKLLMELGYKVDTSVTPSITWTSKKGIKFPDFKKFPEIPYRVSYNGDIWHPGYSDFLEVPVTILKPNMLNAQNQNEPTWFRPWYSDKNSLINIIQNIELESSAVGISRPLVMMFHNVEVIPGISPYPQSESQVIQYLESLSEAVSYAIQMGYQPCTLSEYYDFFMNNYYPNLSMSNISQTMKAYDSQLQLSSEDVGNTLIKYETPSWFEYIFRDRLNRWDVCLPTLWIVENISFDKQILETGCGVGFNLMWLAEQGFKNLNGFDIDPKTINAGTEIANNAHLPINLWIDNGLIPNLIPNISYSIIIALNWTFLIEKFSLDEFIKTYIPYLDEKGAFIFDVIDATFNQMPDNLYRSSDLGKPIEERQLSEYKIRLSEKEVLSILNKHGLKIIQTIKEEQKIPKTIYIASRHSLAEINEANPQKVLIPKRHNSIGIFNKLINWFWHVFSILL